MAWWHIVIAIISSLSTAQATPTPEDILNHLDRYYVDDGDTIGTCAVIDDTAWCFPRPKIRVEA